jgi:hypothetical protein
MIHPRLFARVRPKGLVSKAAKIIVAPQAPAIDCTIVDFAGRSLSRSLRTDYPAVAVRIALGRYNKKVPRRLEIRKADGRRFLEAGCRRWIARPLTIHVINKTTAPTIHAINTIHEKRHTTLHCKFHFILLPPASACFRLCAPLRKKCHFAVKL